MAKRLVSRISPRRPLVVATVLATAVGLGVYAGAGSAGAAPAPTITQVKAKISTLQGQVDKIDQEYDAEGQQLTAAKARLTQVTKQANRAQAQYNQASAALTAVAVAGYENQGQSSIVGLLTSGDPSQVLSQASLVLQIEGTQNEEAQQLLTTAKQLASIKEQRQRTEQGVAQLTAQYSKQRQSMTKLLDTQTTLLHSLTAQQQEQVEATEVGGTSSPTQVDTTPTSETHTGSGGSGAAAAVSFASAQLGCPYVYGGTGPCSDGFDCSGLVQAAWAAAGVSIPRTTYEDWSELPHVPLSDLEPGDLILYDGEGHVAMYVGDGEIIDAPHTGADVEKIPEDSDWYAQEEDGAVRP